MKSVFDAMQPVQENLVQALNYQQRLSGHILEFGVYQGNSINKIARAITPQRVYGFDTFTGLPEPWVRSDNDVYDTGHFNMHGNMPSVPGNVTLIKGELQQTFPKWLEQNSGPIGFIHVDTDLYSAARDILTLSNDRIHGGTVIVFDELIEYLEPATYTDWPEGEYKALLEWTEQHGRQVSPLNRGANRPQSCAVVVIK